MYTLAFFRNWRRRYLLVHPALAKCSIFDMHYTISFTPRSLHCKKTPHPAPLLANFSCDSWNYRDNMSVRNNYAVYRPIIDTSDQTTSYQSDRKAPCDISVVSVRAKISIHTLQDFNQ